MEKKIMATLVLTMLSGMAFASDDNAANNTSTTNQAEDRVGSPSGHLSGKNEGMSGNVVGGDGTASDNAATDSMSGSSADSDSSLSGKSGDADNTASPQTPGPGGSGMGVADQDTAHSKAPQ